MRTTLLSLSLITLLSSCVPLVKEDNPQPNNNTNTATTTTTTQTDWLAYKAVDVRTLVKSIYSSTNELFILSDNQFIRMDANDNVIEKRALADDRQLYGSPVVSENTFMRISQGNDNKQVVEFHLTRNAASQKIITSSLVDSELKESFQIDFFGRSPGCYNADGTKYILPGVVYPYYKSTLMILDIKLTPDNKNFQSISLNKRIEIPALSTDGKIEACRFLSGNFYLATKDGGFRITPEGQVTKIFKNWTYDFFEKDGKLYSTGFASADFYTSSDNGLSWRTYGNGSLKYVENVGNKLINQLQRGLAFDLVDNSFLKPVPMKYNADFPTQPDTYYTIAFMKNQFYMNVGNKIYIAKELKAK
jgi:hypothetical protein